MASDEEVRLIIKAATEQAVSNLRKLNDQLENQNQTSNKLQGAITKLKSGWLAYTAAIGGSIVVMNKIVSSASNLNEEQSKFNVVFGASKQVLAVANDGINELRKNYAMSELEAKKLTGGMGDILKPMGFLPIEAAKASIQLTKLAADLGSFKNLPTADALNAIRSAIVGETEPMRHLGVVLNESILKQEAMNLKLYDGKGNLTAYAKAQAAMSVIIRSTKDAQGDMIRTSDSYANTLKRAQAAQVDMSSSLGKILLPAFTAMMSTIASVASWVSNLSNGWRTAIISISLAGIAIAVLTKIVIAFGVSLSAAIWPITLIVAGIAGIVLAIKNWKYVMYGLEVAWNAIVYAAQKAWKFIELVFLNLALSATQSAANLVQPFVWAINKIIEAYNKLTGSHKEMIDNVVQQGADYLNKKIVQVTAESEAIRMKHAQEVQSDKEAKTVLEDQQIEHNENLATIETEKQQSEEAKLLESLNKKYAAAKAYTAKIVKLDTDYFKFRLKSYGFDADNYQTWQSFIMTNADKNSKWQFRLWQAMSIQQTIIETYKAAVAAFSAMAGIPYVGPALGAAAAAAAVAMGMGMVAKIASTKPGNAEEGGIIRGSSGNGTLFYAGEHNKDEAIIPLESEDAQEKLGGLGGTVNVNFDVQYLVSDRGLPEAVAKEIDKALYLLKQRGLSRAFA